MLRGGNFGGGVRRGMPLRSRGTVFQGLLHDQSHENVTGCGIDPCSDRPALPVGGDIQLSRMAFMDAPSDACGSRPRDPTNTSIRAGRVFRWSFR